MGSSERKPPTSWIVRSVVGLGTSLFTGAIEPEVLLGWEPKMDIAFLQVSNQLIYSSAHGKSENKTRRQVQNGMLLYEETA
jgi:hypothetical protein